MNNDIAIKVENLTKIYRLYDKPLDRLKETFHPFKKKYHREFYALNDVSFEVKRGETVGIIGKNGAGKSTLLQIITGVLTPTSGNITVNGKISALLELGAGFNPELTGIENIYFSGTNMGYTQEEIQNKIADIIAFADIGDFINQPMKLYSSGMYMRVAFAIAINVDPDVLIIDEALAVGDIRFSQKCFRILKEFKDNGRTILFVSHDTGAIINFCNKAIWLIDGRVYQIGEPDDIVKSYVAYMAYEFIATNRKVSKEIPVKDLIKETNNIIFSIDDLSLSDRFLEINGWAYIKDENSENMEISIVLKSEKETYCFSTQVQCVPHVTRFYKDLNLNLDNSGFVALIPRDVLKMDIYKIGIYIKKDKIEGIHYTDRSVDCLFDMKKIGLSSKAGIEWGDVSGLSTFGEGGAEIKGVALYGKSPYIKMNILTGGETVVFYVNIEIKRNIYSPIVGFVLNDEYGNSILGINNYILGKKLDDFFEGEKVILKFEFEFPSLKNGRYSFSPAIAEGTQENHVQLHWIHDAYIIEIASKEKDAKMVWYYLIKEANIDVLHC